MHTPACGAVAGTWHTARGSEPGARHTRAGVRIFTLASPTARGRHHCLGVCVTRGCAHTHTRTHGRTGGKAKPGSPVHVAFGPGLPPCAPHRAAHHCFLAPCPPPPPPCPTHAPAPRAPPLLPPPPSPSFLPAHIYAGRPPAAGCGRGAGHNAGGCFGVGAATPWPCGACRRRRRRTRRCGGARAPAGQLCHGRRRRRRSAAGGREGRRLHRAGGCQVRPCVRSCVRPFLRAFVRACCCCRFAPVLPAVGMSGTEPTAVNDGWAATA